MEWPTTMTGANFPELWQQVLLQASVGQAIREHTPAPPLPPFLADAISCPRIDMPLDRYAWPVVVAVVGQGHSCHDGP